MITHSFLGGVFPYWSWLPPPPTLPFFFKQTPFNLYLNPLIFFLWTLWNNQSFLQSLFNSHSHFQSHPKHLQFSNSSTPLPLLSTSQYLFSTSKIFSLPFIHSFNPFRLSSTSSNDSSSSQPINPQLLKPRFSQFPSTLHFFIILLHSNLLQKNTPKSWRC